MRDRIHPLTLLSIPPAIQLRLAGRDGVTLPQPHDIFGAGSVRRLARLRQVDEARERAVRLAEAPDCVACGDEERNHESDKEEFGADDEEGWGRAQSA